MFSCTDAQAFQLYTVLVVEDFVQSVTQLRPEFLASSSFKFRSGIGWTFDDKEKGKKRQGLHFVYNLDYNTHGDMSLSWGNPTLPPSGRYWLKPDNNVFKMFAFLKKGSKINKMF